MTRRYNVEVVSDLGPGDKFRFKDTYYVVIDMEPTGFFAGTNITDYVCALDTDTYRVMCFGKNCEVEVLYYYGGI